MTTNGTMYLVAFWRDSDSEDPSTHGGNPDKVRQFTAEMQESMDVSGLPVGFFKVLNYMSMELEQWDRGYVHMDGEHDDSDSADDFVVDPTPKPTGKGWYIKNDSGWWGPYPLYDLLEACDPEGTERVYHYDPKRWIFKTHYYGRLASFIDRTTNK